MRTRKCKNKCYGQECLTKALFGTMLLLGLVTLQTSQAAVQPIAKVDEQLEKAILAEDWEKVIQLLPAEAEPNMPVYLRLVKGHACLATNRNNESLCLFLSATSKEKLQKWQKWSQDFATKYPVSPIAHYFKGDALARLRRWNAAISVYGDALAQAENNRHALVFNGRGVAHARHNKLLEARLDFARAIKYSGRTLADAYANIGALRIQKKDGAEGALKAFNKALKISPTFALALHGRGCVRLVLREALKAEEDLKKAQEYGTCSGGAALMARNNLKIAAYWRGVTESELLAAIQSGRDAGTMIDSTLQPVTKAWDNFKAGAGKPFGQFKYNRFHEGFGTLSPSQQERFFSETIASDLKANSGLHDIYNQALNNVRDWNRPGGAANAIGDGLQIGGGAATVLGGAHGNLPVASGGVAAAFWGTKIKDWNPHNFGAANRLDNLGNRYLSQRTSGGFDMSLANMAWDGGEWPFLGYYGLLFHVDATELLLGHTKASNDENVVTEVTK